MASVLIPLPDRGFDTTEVAVPWKLLCEASHDVAFATEHGHVKPACDPLLLGGVLFGQLGAADEPKRFYAELQNDAAFISPRSWNLLDPASFDALLLPGGHAPGMRQYLGSPSLQNLAGAFMHAGKPVGAICHGVLVLARSIDVWSRKSALCGRKTTCLPRYMERTAYLLTAWKLGRYYRTYELYVEDEVCAALETADDFERGPLTLVARGTRNDDRPAFVVEDGNYVSARWPGDAYLFAKRFIARLTKPQGARVTPAHDLAAG